MLTSLHIENVAIIDNSDVEFLPGFNVLTGETGAGKSILIDSINLMLGHKAKRDFIGINKDSGSVTACFCDLSEQALALLKENDIEPDDDGNIIIYRRLSRDGRNTARINGIAVPVSLLKAVGERLINIHGQHDGVRLLDPQTHITFLDEFCKSGSAISEYEQQYARVKAAKSAVQQLEKQALNKNELVETLTGSLDEIRAADLKEGEYDELLRARSVMQQSIKLNEALREGENALYLDEQSALAQVERALEQLGSIVEYEPQLNEIIKSLESMRIELDEAGHTVRHLLSELEQGEYSEEYIENRLSVLEQIKKKYGPSDRQVLEKQGELEYKLEQIENNETELRDARDVFRLELEKLSKLAEKIHNLRAKGAKSLELQIQSELKELDMPSVTFTVQIEKNTNQRGGISYLKNGYDRVEFLISTNVGQPPKPLAKIASGGELSRIMLCLKSILTSMADCDTVIYDEIDSGVSGSTAHKIGKKLLSVSAGRQVLCVTHLAQIAALAEHHFLVEKQVLNNKTVSGIRLLDSGERTKEVARIMGGENITEQLLKSADELINGNDN